MGKKLTKVYVHLVWATALRAPVLLPAVREWLWPAMAEKARAMGAPHVVVGGYVDHVHVLLSLPATVPISEFVRQLKGSSVYTVRLRSIPDFSWQEGYAAISVSPDSVEAVTRYVCAQESHHRDGDTRMDLEEFAA